MTGGRMLVPRRRPRRTRGRSGAGAVPLGGQGGLVREGLADGIREPFWHARLSLRRRVLRVVQVAPDILGLRMGIVHAGGLETVLGFIEGVIQEAALITALQYVVDGAFTHVSAGVVGGG